MKIVQFCLLLSDSLVAGEALLRLIVLDSNILIEGDDERIFRLLHSLLGVGDLAAAHVQVFGQMLDALYLSWQVVLAVVAVLEVGAQ